MDGAGGGGGAPQACVCQSEFLLLLRVVQTCSDSEADSCLDWAGASRPLASPQQRQVRAFS